MTPRAAAEQSVRSNLVRKRASSLGTSKPIRVSQAILLPHPVQHETTRRLTRPDERLPRPLRFLVGLDDRQVSPVRRVIRRVQLGRRLLVGGSHRRCGHGSRCRRGSCCWHRTLIQYASCLYMHSSDDNSVRQQRETQYHAQMLARRPSIGRRYSMCDESR